MGEGEGARSHERASSLADKFWTLARQVGQEQEPSSLEVVEQFLVVLAEFSEASPDVGQDLSANSLSLLALLRRHEVEGDLTYASPEQARGEPVDERALVFSVGVLLFERLTGRHPFGAEGNPQRLARIQRGEMMSGVNYFPKIPAELRAIVVKAIAAFPEERWNNLADLRKQLNAFVHYASGGAPKQRRKRESKLPAVPEVSGRLPSKPVESLPKGQLPELNSRFAVDAEDEETQVRAAPRAEPQPPISEPNAMAPARRSPMAPILWMVLGAGAASVIIFAVLSVGKGAEETPRAAKVAPAEKSQTEVGVTNAQTTASAKTEVAEPRPAAPAHVAPVAAPTKTPVKEQMPAAEGDAELATDRFSVEVGRSAVQTALIPCFAQNKGAHFFGASLLYTTSGTAKRAYLGGVSKLSPEQRSCVQKALPGTRAGGAPAKSTVVEYSIVVKQAEVTAKVRVVK